MCWSCQASIFAFSFAWLCAAGTYWLPAPTEKTKETHLWFTSLFAVVALIQLIEAVMWRTINDKTLLLVQKQNKLNILTRSIWIALFFQCVTNCLCLIHFGFAGFSHRHHRSVAVEPDSLVWYTWWIISSCCWEMRKAFLVTAKKWTTVIGPHGHLLWCSALVPTSMLPNNQTVTENINEGELQYVPQFSWHSGTVYMVGLCFPLFWLPMYSTITLVALFTSLAYARYRSSQGETGSHWCYVGSFLSALPLLIFAKTQLLG